MNTTQLEAMKSQALSASQDLKINGETESVRIVVLDRDSGRAGSVTLPVRPQDRSSASTPNTTKETQTTTAPKTPVH